MKITEGVDRVFNFQEEVILQVEEIYKFFEESVIDVVLGSPWCELLAISRSADCPSA